MIRRFSQQKYNESKRQEFLTEKQREEEETRKAQANKMKWEQEYLSRKQESGEDTKEYYTAKEELCLQAYDPIKRSLDKFKDNMLKGLYDAELKEACLFFMAKEPKH